MRCQLLQKVLLDILEVRFAILIGTHKLQRRQQHGIMTLFKQIISHHIGAQNLTLRYNNLLLFFCEHTFGLQTYLIEHFLYNQIGLMLIIVGRIQFIDMRFVLIL